MKRSIVLLFVFVLMPFVTLLAQDEQPEIQKLNTRKTIKMANKLYKKGSFYNALKYYEEAHNRKPENSYVIYRLAATNLLLRDYKLAEKWYKLLSETDPVKYPRSYFMYGLMLKYNGKYEDAIPQFEKFKDSDYSEDDATELIARADKEIEGCELGIQYLASPPVRAKIEHPDESVNNPFTDFAPVPLDKDGNEMMYASIRADSALNVEELKKGNVDWYSKLYTAKFEGDEWKEAELLPAPPNSSEVHTGNAVYNADQSRMYFTRCELNKCLQMDCKIYKSEKNSDGSWGEPEVLGANINAEDATNTHPHVVQTEDGNDALYFVSDREGGQGRKDIWYAEANNSGTFGKAENLGAGINTEWDEITPAYDENEGILYFSSKGQVNIGGFDIFFSQGSAAENDWAEVENLGYPINSSVDDIYYAPADDGKTGFMVSNRPGGFNLKSETCCDDIYRVTIIREIVLEGWVAVRSDPDQTPIGGADVAVFTKDGDELQAVSTITTDEMEHFIVPLEPETVYQFNTTKPGYWGSEEVIDLNEIEVDDTLKHAFLVDEIIKRKIKLKRIYFAFDRYNITRKYKKSLDSLQVVLSNNPDYTLTITGHTDAIGTDAYNMVLGKKRAQAAADYLVAKGISIDRLSLISKGEDEPIKPNTKENGADNKLGRAYNRRVEFEVDTNEDLLEIEIEYTDEEPEGTY